MAGKKNELSNAYQPMVDDIKEIIEKGRNDAYSSVNSIMIMTYWNIGRRIVEEEQRGQERAQYGKKLIKYLSEQLQQTYGSGFSERYLAYFRKFYLTVPDPEILQTRLQNLSWSHILTTLRVGDETARRWYLTNASTQGWSVKLSFEEQLEAEIERQKEIFYMQHPALKEKKEGKADE